MDSRFHGNDGCASCCPPGSAGACPPARLGAVLFRRRWIPVFTGMTDVHPALLRVARGLVPRSAGRGAFSEKMDSRFHGNDGSLSRTPLCNAGLLPSGRGVCQLREHGSRPRAARQAHVLPTCLHMSFRSERSGVRNLAHCPAIPAPEIPRFARNDIYLPLYVRAGATLHGHNGTPRATFMGLTIWNPMACTLLSQASCQRG